MDARYWGPDRQRLTLANLPHDLPLFLKLVALNDVPGIILKLQPTATRAQLLAMRGAGGRTALNIAAELGHFDAFQVLAAFGAHVSAADNEGDGPMHAAAGGNQPAVIEQLLDLGAGIDQPNLLQGNSTPLYVASAAGNAEAACVLVQHGAAVNARGFYNRTCVHAAAASGSMAVLDVLLRPGTEADANAVDADGLTPLGAALDAEPDNLFEVVERLLAAGCTHVRQL